MSEHRQRQKRADNARRRAVQNSIDELFEWGFDAETGCPLPKDPERREACGKSLELFMTTYYEKLFYLEISPGQRDEINMSQAVVLQGGTYAMAAPRGDGKTTRVECATMWAILYGYHWYVVPVGSTQAASDKILDSIKCELSTNEKLAEDFPEVCIPAQACEGSPHKAKSLVFRGEKINMLWASAKIMLPQIEGSKSFGSIVEPKGLSGAIRGMKANVPGQGSMRPTLFLFDDPQDNESAASPTQCDKRENKIKGAALGSGGPLDKVAAFMPCTVIEPDDLAARLLDRKKNPQWHGTTRSMVIRFPDCFDIEGKNEGLWDKYNEMRQEDFRKDLIVPENANNFYIENREAMDKGHEVDNPLRIEEGEISAIQTAMNKLFDKGPKVFFAEYQNKPQDLAGSVYDISPEVVASRLNGFAHYEVPPWAKFLVCMADINYVGLNYCICAFDNDYTGAIVDYGKWPGGRKWLVQPKTPEAEAHRLVAEGVQDLCNQVQNKEFTYNGKRREVDLILIDCNMWTSAAMNAIAALRNPRILPDRGTAASKYRWPQESKRIGRPGDNFHRERSPKGMIQARHCADYWRMVAQKAFLQKVGIPGSISLWGNDPSIHKHFATSVCAERLLIYQQAEPNDIFQWAPVPGSYNDLLDALVGCYVGAGLVGAQMPGIEPVKVTARQRRNRGEQYRSSKSSIRSKY